MKQFSTESQTFVSEQDEHNTFVKLKVFQLELFQLQIFFFLMKNIVFVIILSIT